MKLLYGALDLKHPGGPKFSDYRWGKRVRVRLKSLRWDFMIFFLSIVVFFMLWNIYIYIFFCEQLPFQNFDLSKDLFF